MTDSESGLIEDAKLRNVALAYYVVMLVAFVIGLYGLISLFSLATAEIQQGIHLG